MVNQELAKIFREIGEYLLMDDVPFKPQAYERAAMNIEILEEDLEAIYKRGGFKLLRTIPGVGEAIASKIIEYIETGHIDEYEKLKKKAPVNLSELRGVEGLGPKHIKNLYQELGIRNVKDLEKAARARKIRILAGFGEKSEEKILRAVQFYKKRADGRYLLWQIMPFVRQIEERLNRLKEVKRLVVAGSIRRRKETVGDADILIISNDPEPVMEYFTKMPEATSIIAHGKTKSSIKTAMGINIDLRVLPRKSYGAGLAYFTGSKEHNVVLRELAIKKEYKLSEYGLFRENRKKKIENRREMNNRWVQLPAETEEEIYAFLGLQYIEPELRENMGEIDASLNGKLPKIIGYGELQGDLQIQTTWTDGKNTIEEMAKAAMKKGLEYIAITDHTKRLAMTGGLDEKKIIRQWKEIDAVNKKLRGEIKILKGSECDILRDGTLDLPDEVLSKLDVCGAAIHSYFNLSKKEQTERIKRAMKNPNVDILFHPTGRIIQKRDPYELDIDDIIKTAKETGTILEIDAYPDRSDLKDDHIRKCVEVGVKMAIDSDAHSAQHLDLLEYGIAQARRGWATKNDIINAWPVDEMLRMLKNR